MRGERVFVLTGRIPALYTAVLGSFKAGCVVSPLFSAFGPEPIATRINIGEGQVLVTTDLLYSRKVRAWRERIAARKSARRIGADELTHGNVCIARR